MSAWVSRRRFIRDLTVVLIAGFHNIKRFKESVIDDEGSLQCTGFAFRFLDRGQLGDGLLGLGVKVRPAWKFVT